MTAGLLGLIETPGAVGGEFKITTEAEVTGEPEAAPSVGVAVTTTVSPRPKGPGASTGLLVPTGLPFTVQL